MKKTEEKDSFALIKIIIDALGPVLTIVAILVGISNFNEEQRRDTEKEKKNQEYLDVMEFKRKNWEKQQEVYVELSKIIGSITNGDSLGKDEQLSVNEFLKLYYGKAAFVEDEEVARKMRKFYDDLNDYKDKYRTRNELKASGFELIASLKSSSINSWRNLSRLP